MLESVSWGEEACRLDHVHVTFQVVEHPRSEYLGTLSGVFWNIAPLLFRFPRFGQCVICLPQLLILKITPFSVESSAFLVASLVTGRPHCPLAIHPNHLPLASGDGRARVPVKANSASCAFASLPSLFFLRLLLNQSSPSPVFLQHLSFHVVLDVTFYVRPLLGRIILRISLSCPVCFLKIRCIPVAFLPQVRTFQFPGHRETLACSWPAQFISVEEMILVSVLSVGIMWSWFLHDGPLPAGLGTQDRAPTSFPWTASRRTPN